MPEAAPPAGKAKRKKMMDKTQKTTGAFGNLGTGIPPFTVFSAL
jgi:hypothetical protein